MEIFLNGEQRQVEEGCTVAALITELNLQGKRLAIEVNLEIVPHSQLEQHILSAGDKVEIVHAIGGGCRT